MAEFDHALHHRRVHDLAAIERELLPDPGVVVGKIEAEFRDANLARDKDLEARTDEECDRLQTAASRMAGLWQLMIRAQESRSEALSASTADELKRTILSEFGKRGGGGLP